jgi:hypothetical protein
LRRLLIAWILALVLMVLGTIAAMADPWPPGIGIG